MATLSSPPANDSIVQIDPQDPQRNKPFYASLTWIRWFLDVQIPALQAAAAVKASLALQHQHATIGLTPLGILSAGLYQVSYYARITTPDGVSSSLTVTVGWTEGGQTLSLSGAPMTGDSLTTVQSGTVLVVLDPNATITIGATYASNTPNAMQFRLTAVAVLVG